MFAINIYNMKCIWQLVLTFCWPPVDQNQLILTTLNFPSSGKGHLERNPPQRVTFHTLKVQSASSPAVRLAVHIWGWQTEERGTGTEHTNGRIHGIKRTARHFCNRADLYERFTRLFKVRNLTTVMHLFVRKTRDGGDEEWHWDISGMTFQSL